MDSILLIGSTDGSLKVILERMGYKVLANNSSFDLAHLSENVADLVMIDSRASFDCIELIGLLREESSTRWLPIILICDSPATRERIDAAGISRIEYIDVPYSAPAIIGKVATVLRLRKLVGSDNRTLSIAEMNASLREMNARFAKELEEARKIQETLLPALLPSADNFQIAACYLPLEEVGGDWYYADKLADGRILVQIADVTGHGLSAALVGSMTKLALVASKKGDAAELLGDMNRLMTPLVPEGKFVTIATYLYDPASGALNYARGGHPPGIHIQRSSSQALEVKGQGLAIGFMDEAVYQPVELRLEVGDLFVVFSDAIPESQNRARELYGMDRVKSSLLQLDPAMSAEQVLDQFLMAFKNFCDGRAFKDDITVIILRRIK